VAIPSEIAPAAPALARRVALLAMTNKEKTDPDTDSDPDTEEE